MDITVLNAELLDGIINLLGAIQDEAVFHKYATPEEVFGKIRWMNHENHNTKRIEKSFLG